MMLSGLRIITATNNIVAQQSVLIYLAFGYYQLFYSHRRKKNQLQFADDNNAHNTRGVQRRFANSFASMIRLTLPLFILRIYTYNFRQSVANLRYTITKQIEILSKSEYGRSHTTHATCMHDVDVGIKCEQQQEEKDEKKKLIVISFME